MIAARNSQPHHPLPRPLANRPPADLHAMSRAELLPHLGSLLRLVGRRRCGNPPLSRSGPLPSRLELRQRLTGRQPKVLGDRALTRQAHRKPRVGRQLPRRSRRRLRQRREILPGALHIAPVALLQRQHSRHPDELLIGQI